MTENPLVFRFPEFARAARIRLENVSCRVGGRRVCGVPRLDVETGDAIMLSGPNGSGKTSLLRMLAGLLPLGGGRMTFSGFASGRCCHYLGHADGLKVRLSAYEQASFQADAYPRAVPGFVAPDPDAVLDGLGLAACRDRRVGDMSAGQRRRLAFSRLCLAPRQVWLLDEPVTALDAAARSLLRTLVAAHRERGGMILAAVHEDPGFSGRTIGLPDGAPRAEAG